MMKNHSDLSRPITLPAQDRRGKARPPGLRKLAEALGEEEWLAAERERKLRLLLEYYRLKQSDPDMWPKLALALCEDYVPGWKAGGNAGRPGGTEAVRRGAVDTAALIGLVEELKRQGVSVAEAARRIFALKDPRFSAAGSAHSLEKLFHRAKEAERAEPKPRLDPLEAAPVIVSGEISKADAARLERISAAWMEYFFPRDGK